MTTLALSTLLQTSPRRFGRLFEHCSAFLAGIEEARAMALRYDALAQLSDSELAALGASSVRTSRAPCSPASAAPDCQPPTHATDAAESGRRGIRLANDPRPPAPACDTAEIYTLQPDGRS